MAIRVVAEAQWLLREAVASVVGRAEDMQLVAAVDCPEALVDSIADHRPDVVVTEARLSGGDREEARLAARLRDALVGVGVVILSADGHPAFAAELMRSRGPRTGRALLVADHVESSAEVLDAIRVAYRGGMHVDREIERVLGDLRYRTEHSPLRELTARELDTLAEIAQGKSNQAIAADLGLSQRAVEKHINAIFHKLLLHNGSASSARVKATLLFLRDTETRSVAPDM